MDLESDTLLNKKRNCFQIVKYYFFEESVDEGRCGSRCGNFWITLFYVALLVIVVLAIMYPLGLITQIALGTSKKDLDFDPLITFTAGMVGFTFLVAIFLGIIGAIGLLMFIIFIIVSTIHDCIDCYQRNTIIDK